VPTPYLVSHSYLYLLYDYFTSDKPRRTMYFVTSRRVNVAKIPQYDPQCRLRLTAQGRDLDMVTISSGLRILNLSDLVFCGSWSLHSTKPRIFETGPLSYRESVIARRLLLCAVCSVVKVTTWLPHGSTVPHKPDSLNTLEKTPETNLP